MTNPLENNYALLIGVGTCACRGWSLPVTVKDIHALNSLLVDPDFCGYINDGHHVLLLYNEKATKEGILAGLDWLKKQTAAKPKDATVIVYYSGHGFLHQSTKQYYLIPHDIECFDTSLYAPPPDSALAATDFNNALREIQAKQLLVVIDSCHAQGMATAKDEPSEPILPTDSSFIQRAFPENLSAELIAELKQGEGRVVLSSSKGHQKSWIRPDQKRSIYTYHFLEALRGARNQSKDKFVKVSDVIRHVEDTVPESVKKFYYEQYKAEQNPWCNWDGQNFSVALLHGGRGLPTLPFDEEFYVEPPIIQSCYNKILQPGSLLRIKAPWQMGKTSLKSKILRSALIHGYQTVDLNLRNTENTDFENLEKFLKWFCSSVTSELRLPPKVHDHWKLQDLNNKVKCQTYFEDYLLTEEKPLALFLDDVDKIFIHENIAGDFLGLMRTWHEAAKTNDIWKQFRLVMVHTEPYTQLKITESPFNAGTEIKSTDLELNQEQVQELGKRYEHNLDTTEVQQIMNMVGGHPHLVRIILEQFQNSRKTLEELLQNATTMVDELNEIKKHLDRHLQNLQKHPELVASFKRIVVADSPVNLYPHSNLNPKAVDKLNDLGLVKLQNNTAVPRYELYRQYFRARLGDII